MSLSGSLRSTVSAGKFTFPPILAFALETSRIYDSLTPRSAANGLFARSLLTKLNRDAFTTSGDFIISPHSTDGLFIATCGSFHGFKFFPVLGKYVIQMMEGTMEKELVDKWAWDRERPDPALNPEWPRSEMKDLQDTTARL